MFYITGGVGCVWFVFWVILSSESPDTDKYISEKERQYIMESIGGNSTKNSKKPPIPWRSIFTSTPVWAINVANFSENWGFYTLLTQLPTFLKDTLDMKLDSTGFVAGLPYLVMSIMLIPSGWLADWAQEKGYLTTTQVRRYFNCGGFLAQTVFMMLAAFVAHPIFSIVCLILAVGLSAFSISGFAVNHLDIAPKFACKLKEHFNQANYLELLTNQGPIHSPHYSITPEFVCLSV